MNKGMRFILSGLCWLGIVATLLADEPPQPAFGVACNVTCLPKEGALGKIEITFTNQSQRAVVLDTVAILHPDISYSIAKDASSAYVPVGMTGFHFINKRSLRMRNYSKAEEIPGAQVLPARGSHRVLLDLKEIVQRAEAGNRFALEVTLTSTLLGYQGEPFSGTMNAAIFTFKDVQMTVSVNKP